MQLILRLSALEQLAPEDLDRVLAPALQAAGSISQQAKLLLGQGFTSSAVKLLAWRDIEERALDLATAHIPAGAVGWPICGGILVIEHPTHNVRYSLLDLLGSRPPVGRDLQQKHVQLLQKCKDIDASLSSLLADGHTIVRVSRARWVAYDTHVLTGDDIVSLGRHAVSRRDILAAGKPAGQYHISGMRRFTSPYIQIAPKNT